MNKTELIALGVPEENHSEFQKLYHRDLRVAAGRTSSTDGIRAAITAMLPMVRRAEHLRDILTSVNYFFYTEGKPSRDRAETEPGKGAT